MLLHRKKPFIVLLICPCTLFLLFTIFELILRSSDFQYMPYPDTIEFGWPPPSLTGKYVLYDEDFFWVTTYYYTTLQKAQTKNPSIVFMGSSANTYVKYFVKKFNASTGRTLSFFNSGVAGWTSYQGLLQFKRDIMPLNPRVVVVDFGWNDHWNGLGYEDKEVAFLNKLCKFKTAQFLLKHFARIQSPKELRGNLSERVSANDFENNLLEIISLAKGKNIKIILLTSPTSHQRGNEPEYLLKERFVNSVDDVITRHQKYMNIIRHVAENQNVILCDAARFFEQFSKQDLQNTYFNNDGIHETALGFETLGDIVFECCKANNLINLL